MRRVLEEGQRLDVTIEERGRCGSVHYREPAGSLSFYWEFGGGDTVAIIQPEDAGRMEGAAVLGARAGVRKSCAVVADEVIRQKAPGARARIDEADGRHYAASGGAPGPTRTAPHPRASSP